MSNEIKVGQQLWFVPNRSAPRYVTVALVGRRWVYFGEYRADVNTLTVDGKGYMSPGRCYLKKDDWLAKNRRREAWDKLRDSVKEYGPPDNISTESIEAAIYLLTGEVGRVRETV